METRTYEREKLYNEVWAEPMTTVAKRYGISDVALRKQCKKLDIPLPKKGHWAKVQAGHKVKVPPLPKSDGPDQTVVFVNDTYKNLSPGLKASDRLLFLSEEEREAVKEYCAGLTVPSELSKLHGLVANTKQYYRARKESTKPPVDRVINITVSEEQRERVYIFYTFSKSTNVGKSVTNFVMHGTVYALRRSSPLQPGAQPECVLFPQHVQVPALSCLKQCGSVHCCTSQKTL
jgi:hypothetical protein